MSGANAIQNDRPLFDVPSLTTSDFTLPSSNEGTLVAQAANQQPNTITTPRVLPDTTAVGWAVPGVGIPGAPPFSTYILHSHQWTADLGDDKLTSFNSLPLPQNVANAAGLVPIAANILTQFGGPELASRADLLAGALFTQAQALQQVINSPAFKAALPAGARVVPSIVATVPVNEALDAGREAQSMSPFGVTSVPGPFGTSLPLTIREPNFNADPLSKLQNVEIGLGLTIVLPSGNKAGSNAGTGTAFFINGRQNLRDLLEGENPTRSINFGALALNVPVPVPGVGRVPTNIGPAYRATVDENGDGPWQVKFADTGQTIDLPDPLAAAANALFGRNAPLTGANFDRLQNQVDRTVADQTTRQRTGNLIDDLDGAPNDTGVPAPATLPTNTANAREAFEDAGLSPDRARVAAFAYNSFIRAGHSQEEAWRWIMNGQEHGGGLTKLVEQGTPATPNSVDYNAFRANGLGTEAANQAVQIYNDLRRAHTVDGRADPPMSPTQAWGTVYDHFLRGLATGGDAGGLQALERLNARVAPEQTTVIHGGAGPIDFRNADASTFSQIGFERHDARIAEFLFDRWVGDGQNPQQAFQWITSAYFTGPNGSGNSAALLERAIPPRAGDVNTSVFRAAGMGENAAALANDAYLGLRQFGSSPEAAWQTVWTNYLQGLGTGGNAGALDRLSELLGRM